MHQPVPHGAFAPGDAPTTGDQGFGERLLKSLVNECTLGGLPKMTLTRTLPDGGTVTALYDHGVARLVYNKGGKVFSQQDDEPVPPQITIPMLVCGNVLKPVVKVDDPVTILVTEQTRKRLANYPEEAPPAQAGQWKRPPRPLPKKKLDFKRFNIDYHPRFSEFKPPGMSLFRQTQYTKLYPSWYSGAMAEVVQIVRGYGKQFTTREWKEMRAENARAKEAGEPLPWGAHEQPLMSLPRGLHKLLARHVDNYDFAAHTGVPDKEGRVLYDYKFDCTHGVGFDGSRKPWLIEVAKRGVHIMPLPMIPMTTSPLFLKYVEKKQDGELKAILEKFGGLPSGECFPEKENDFEAWRKAGVIIKLCEAEEFHHHLPYTQQCGWAFNSTGKQAWNTCYEFEPDLLQYGYTYRLTLELGERIKEVPETGTVADNLDTYLRGLSKAINKLESGEERRAIRYKLKRLGNFAISRRSNNDGERDVDYWRNLEMPPIASSKGQMKRIYRGKLYAPGPPKRHPQIKFPVANPIADGCWSHDFSPEPGCAVDFSKVRCDTIMYTYFVEDDLRVLKYFYDGRQADPKTEDNFEPCMIVGSWSRRTDTSPKRLLGHFYTTEFDVREVTAASWELTEIVGKDLGYGEPEFIWGDHPFPMDAHLSRQRYYKHETTGTSEWGFSLSNALCVPFLTRSAALHTWRRGTAGWSAGFNSALKWMPDPTSYWCWTYHPRYHWHSERGGVTHYVNTAIDKVYGDRYTPHLPHGGRGFSHWRGLKRNLGVGGGWGDLENPSVITIGIVWSLLQGHPDFAIGRYPMGSPNIIPPYLGNPSPWDGWPIWLDYEDYAGASGCNWFADEGSWMEGIPQDVTEAVWRGRFSGRPPYFRPKSWSKTGQTGKAKASLDASILMHPVFLKDEGIDPWYYKISPDSDTGDVFYRAGMKNECGSTMYAALTEQVEGENWHRGSSKLITKHNVLPRFIGVINE